MYPEIHNRLSEIKHKINKAEPLTQQDLADAVTISLFFDKLVTTICNTLKKESNNNE